MTSTEANKRTVGTQRPPVHRRPNSADLSLTPLDREALPAQTVGIIRGEHRSRAAVLHAWLQVLKSTRTESSAPAPALLAAMVDYLRTPTLALHHTREDDVLFRLLRERAPDLGPALDWLSREHQRDKCLTGALADTVERYCGGQTNQDEIEWALETYSRFIEAHTAREEELVFPAANRHLNDADWAEVYAAFSGADT